MRITAVGCSVMPLGGMRLSRERVYEHLGNDYVRAIFRGDPKREEENKYISGSEAKKGMISRRRE